MYISLSLSLSIRIYIYMYIYIYTHPPSSDKKVTYWLEILVISSFSLLLISRALAMHGPGRGFPG